MELTIAPLGAIPAGEGRTFSVEGLRIAVFRTRAGDVFGVQAECPHRGGPLADGLTGGSTVVCPLHAWKFDLTTGAALNGTCVLTTFPVRIDASGQIVITLPAPPAMSPFTRVTVLVLETTLRRHLLTARHRSLCLH